MIAKAESPVSFVDGYVFRKDLVVIAGRVDALADYQHSRIFFWKNGEWLSYDVKAVVRSVCGMQGQERSLYVLGRDGTVFVSKGGQDSAEKIPEAGTGKGRLGYVRVIRQISGTLYVCGVSGQVYRKERSEWIHVDEGILDRRGANATDLYSIDGSSGTDIYVAGEGGSFFHYDGQRWNRIALPTTVHLNWVRCASPTEVYVCGNAGAFFRKIGSGWEECSLTRYPHDFWCIEVFQGLVYLASDIGIYVFDGKQLVRATTKLKPVPDGYRLHANDGVLWSFGNRHLCFFDGKSWTYVKHPDNP